MSDLTYLVVGAGVAGAKAVAAIRDLDSGGRIILIGDERDHPYERPPLSKGYLAGDEARDKISVHEPEWYGAHGVDLMLGTRVTGIDRAARSVELADGTRIGYDRLLLVTGSAPRRLSIPGTDLDEVHYLRRVGNSDRLRATIGRGEPLVVVGAGWIGLEVAAVARQAGCPVTVVEPQEQPLLQVMGPQVGARFAALHRDHGVDLRLGTGVQAILGDGRVEAVRLDGDVDVPATAVLIGVGIRPLTELAEAAGLEVDDGVVVDDTLRTGDPNIWAAGDVANAENAWVGRRLRVEHFANATDQGALVGRIMAGAQERWAQPPFFWTDQYDLAMEYRGWADPAKATVVLRDGPGDGVWFAFWLDGDGAVQAGMHVNGWDDADDVAALVKDRARVDQRALADPGTSWADARRG